MPEIAFYHCTRLTADAALPQLLEKSLEREWRVVVHLVSEQRLAQLDAHLWTYRPDAFLPHGSKKDGEPETQPVYLTTANDNPNDADARFFLGGVSPAACLADPKLAPKERIVILFDEKDDIVSLRIQYKDLLSHGLKQTYWQENEDGRWVKKDEKNA